MSQDGEAEARRGGTGVWPLRDLGADPDPRQHEASSPGSQASAPTQSHCAAQLWETPWG